MSTTIESEAREQQENRHLRDHQEQEQQQQLQQLSQQQQQQQHGIVEGQEEEVPQFSPFSSLAGLTSTTVSTIAPTSTGDLCTSPSPAEDPPVVSPASPAGVHVKRAVFTISAGSDNAPPYLTKQLKQLEDLEGLVTLSTDNENKNAEIFSSDDLSSKVSNSPAEIAKNPRSKESAACTAREGRETSILRACITETVSDKTDRATRVYPDCNHEEEGPPPIEEKSIPTELKVTYSDSIQDDSTRYPSLSSHVRNEERLGPANTGNRLNVVYTTSTSVGRTLTATDTSETVTTKERWTQTESAPSPPTVDFYLWERRRLACNGWGYHLHNGDPPLPLVFPNGQFINPDGHPCGGPQKIFPSKSKSSTRSDLGVRRCNSAEAAVSPCTTKTVSFSTQTRSPSIKPSSLQIKNVSGHSHSLSHKSDPKSQTYDSEPVCVITSEVATDLPVHVSGASTPFDSTSTTPRAYDKTLDLLESSRSTSVLSDSGTSLSIPSEIISSAKPFTDRTRQNKSACGMADVSTDHPSLATTPPLSGSEGMGSPHSPPAEPTLKVEYVTKVWDAYISDFLLASDHIKEAAIFDRVTATCIAASFDFIISSSEFDQLQRSLSNLIEATKNGVTLKGKRYKTFLADGRRGLMAKGEERSGCSACQTRTLVLVAVHDHTGKPSRCNEEVMRLGDFFWAKGL